MAAPAAVASRLTTNLIARGWPLSLRSVVGFGCAFAVRLSQLTVIDDGLNWSAGAASPRATPAPATAAVVTAATPSQGRRVMCASIPRCLWADKRRAVVLGLRGVGKGRFPPPAVPPRRRASQGTKPFRPATVISLWGSQEDELLHAVRVGLRRGRRARLDTRTSAGATVAPGLTPCLRLNARPPTALQLVYLASDARASEPAAERGVGDAVVARESP